MLIFGAKLFYTINTYQLGEKLSSTLWLEKESQLMVSEELED